MANSNGHKLTVTAGLIAMKKGVHVQLAKITYQMQFLDIAVVVSITTKATDQLKMETVQLKPSTL